MDLHCVPIGTSREGRTLHGWICGSGPLRISLIAGCHGDEPMGPWCLERLLDRLQFGDDPLLREATLVLVPDANPDARAHNSCWAPSLERISFVDFLLYRQRELPGDDLEFGFPGAPEGDAGLRPEAVAIAQFLQANGPFHAHGSLHGLGFGAGPWFLVEPTWADRLAPYEAACRQAVAQRGVTVHDVDRQGEKGFVRLSEGFCTRPDSRAMRAFFEAREDFETAQKFRPSSMEFVRSFSPDAFTFVSEVPLFVTPLPTAPHWQEHLARWTVALRRNNSPEVRDRVRTEAADAGLFLMPPNVQLDLIEAQIRAAVSLVANTPP